VDNSTAPPVHLACTSPTRGVLPCADATTESDVFCNVPPLAMKSERAGGDRRGGARGGQLTPPGFRSKLFEGLKPSEITAVLAAAQRRKVSPDQVLQHEGTTVRRLSLLVTGLAAFYKGAPEGTHLFLRWITPGDAFGLAALRPGSPYLTTVKALQESSILVWDRVSAYALFSQIPRLAGNAYAVVGDYLSELADLLIARTTQTAQQRISRALVQSARQVGRAGTEGIELPLTNEQLAEIAYVSSFTASRQLSEWQNQGILAKSRGKILLRAPKRLDSQYF